MGGVSIGVQRDVGCDHLFPGCVEMHTLSNLHTCLKENKDALRALLWASMPGVQSLKQVSPFAPTYHLSLRTRPYTVQKQYKQTHRFEAPGAGLRVVFITAVTTDWHHSGGLGLKVGFGFLTSSLVMAGHVFCLWRSSSKPYMIPSTRNPHHDTLKAAAG